MKASTYKPLPLVPLLRTYVEGDLLRFDELVQVPVLGPRFAAILSARESILSDTFLDRASEAEFRTALLQFYDACVHPPLHRDTVAHRAGIVRHAIAHLLRCADPLARRVEHCLSLDGPYYVEGLEPVFWSALFQALDFGHNPGWTPAIEAGLRRLGLARWRPHAKPGRVYSALMTIYAQLRAMHGELSALHLDHFLTLVGRMEGRDLWTSLMDENSGIHPRGSRSATRTRFGGFCADTFRFLEELGRNNLLEWMDGERERYHFAVREPLIELCKALAERYVEPVLRGEYGWDLETGARNGRALGSICKNDYGRSTPYKNVLWITYYRRDRGDKREDVQFFVRLSPAGLSYGLRLGADARAVEQLLRQNVQHHGDLLFAALHQSGAFAECHFGTEGSRPSRSDSVALVNGMVPQFPADLANWADQRGLVVARVVPAGSPLLLSDELVGDILLTFDRLVPLYACAVEADPAPVLERKTGTDRGHRRYAEADFQRDTHLDGAWLTNAQELLRLKRQLILQGVPGTGKTHVARCLACLLAQGHDDAVRLVQFHPAYSYEEFVEGIRVKSVEANGRHDVTYPVEDGLLCAFAAEAERRPTEPHVLVIDEINRGNLPRIFGELLYLLEYREQSLVLPYSKRSFQLPANLYLIGTMNAADRSVAVLDQALRRRFSFLEMAPNPTILRAWLRLHPPTEGTLFAEKVVQLFERLNERLRADLGPLLQIGHSYFMVPDLDWPRLRAVWEHHVEPLLAEYFNGQPGRMEGYELTQLMGGDHSQKATRRTKQAARGAGAAGPA